MVALLRDVVPLLALVALLAVAVTHPRPRVEGLVAFAAAGSVLATGVMPADDLRSEAEHLLPVVLFLIAILVVAECCRAEGLFAAIGARLGRTGSADALFAWSFLAAAVVTVVLSLDATVVLLTPVAIAAAAASRPALTPALQLLCVRLANSASLLLPVSNLTNLLAMPSVDLSFGRFALLMLPPFLLTLAIEYGVHRRRFRDAFTAGGREVPLTVPPIARVPVAVVAAMLAGFAVGSGLGVDPAWVAGAAAVALGARALVRRTTRPADLVGSTHPTFAVFVLALGVVVAGVAQGPLGDLVAEVVPTGDGLADLLLLALLGGVLANLLNNLPATLLLAPLAAPLGPEAVLAVLIGINLGSSLTWPGSLANLLWRRTVRAGGGSVSSRDFHLVGLTVVPVAVVSGVTALHLWAMVI